MATPFTNRSTASSISESSFAGRAGQPIYPSSRIYDERGNIWQYQPTSSISPRPRLAKVKSSPGNGALAAARTAGEPAPRRLHKRNNSASSPMTTNADAPKVPPTMLPGEYALASPKNAGTAKSKSKIKPFLHKFSSKENVNDKGTPTIDLSRSAAENEGLGIFTSHRSDSPSYSTYNQQARPNGGATMNRHQRSNSQLSSTTTTSSRYNNPLYTGTTIHQPPSSSSVRPYASPINTSVTSSLSSDHLPLGAATSLTNSETSYLRQTSPSTSRRPTNLHLRQGSSSRNNNPLTNHNTSQTNLPGTPSSLRNPLSNQISSPPPPNTTTSTSNIMPTGAPSLTARSSFDSVFTRISKRSRANTAQQQEIIDPATQAATVAALRQQFDERERRKQEKYDEEERRKVDKLEEKMRKEKDKSEERLRKVKSKEEIRRRKARAAGEDVYDANTRGGGGGGGAGGWNEKTGGYGAAVVAAGYAGRGGAAGGGGGGGATSTTTTTTAMRRKPARSSWQLFLFRIRTMWLRFLKKMGMA